MSRSLLAVVSGILSLVTFALAFVPAATFPMATVAALSVAWLLFPPEGRLADPRRQIAVLVGFTVVAAIVTVTWTHAWS